MVLKKVLWDSNGDTDLEWTYGHGGVERERLRFMERITWKLSLPYVK